MLYRGTEFEEACQNEKHMALLEYLCGGVFTIWQYLASVRGIGTNGLPVHCDLGNGAPSGLGNDPLYFYF